MGIRGLTTFINNRSHLYLKDHQLHDCNVVIDGNSLASNLYKWHCKSNECFGGDYDKFAAVVRSFFGVLSQCNVVPYVVLDGGYEKRKLRTVYDRMRNKIRSANNLSAFTEGSGSVFPLFLREVFVDVVLDLKLKMVRCQFEGDMEIATVAQILNCPVISYDSDFYVFGCLYIPFSTVDITVRKNKDKQNSFVYISCKMYRIETFLEAFGGLDKNNLPLFSILLGNDYINGKLFSPFYRNLKMQKCSGNQSDQQKRIKSVIVWLQNENVSSAIGKIISRFKGPRREFVLRRIKSAMNGYCRVQPELLNYLGIEAPRQSEVEIPILPVNNEDSASDDDDDEGENSTKTSEDDDSNPEESIIQSENKCAILSETFEKHYTSCQYPACFMDMVTLNRYYCIPQIEESTLPHSHTIALPVLSAIYKILKPNNPKTLTIVFRAGRERINYTALPQIELELPTLEDVQHFDQDSRKLVLIKCLSIDNKFLEALNQFPNEWHIFLICLEYAINNGAFDLALIYSCIICFVILNYIDVKVGFCRVSKTFEKKFASVIDGLKTHKIVSDFTNFSSLETKECLLFMDKMIGYFQMDLKLKSNHRLFDKTLVHSTSELQSVFLHIKYLNSILNYAFPTLQIQQIFDGTFLYNMTVNLRKRSCCTEYLNGLLKDCPSVLTGLNAVFNFFKKQVDNCKLTVLAKKKRRKKQKKQTESTEEIVDVGNEDKEIEQLLDPNNPYSILSVTIE